MLHSLQHLPADIQIQTTALQSVVDSSLSDLSDVADSSEFCSPRHIRPICGEILTEGSHLIGVPGRVSLLSLFNTGASWIWNSVPERLVRIIILENGWYVLWT